MTLQQYESKSFEELRLEDYAANRRGPQTGGVTNGGLFGTSLPQAQSSLFGATTQPKPLSMFGGAQPTPSLFGAATQPTQSTTIGGGLFGTTPAAAGLFGGAKPATTNLFGTTTTTPQPATQPFTFGGATAQQPTNSLFGAAKPAMAPAAGGGLFGAQPATNQPAPFCEFA